MGDTKMDAVSSSDSSSSGRFSSSSETSSSGTVSTSDTIISLGCYTDCVDHICSASNRALPYGPQTYDYDITSCSNACIDHNFFALQNGGQCFCGNDLAMAQQYGASTECPSDQLGAAWANNLFIRMKNFDSSFDTVASSSASNSADSASDSADSASQSSDAASETVASSPGSAFSSSHAISSSAGPASESASTSADSATKSSDSASSSEPASESTDSASDSFTSLGCYADNADNRALPFGLQAIGYDITSCSIACSDFDYFALQNGGQCFCTKNLAMAQQYGPSTGCPSDGLGGWLANNLFTRTTPVAWLGCYADSASNRALPFGPQAIGYDVTSCRKACHIDDYQYFALQNGGQCFCGNDLTRAKQYGKLSKGCPFSQLGGDKYVRSKKYPSQSLLDLGFWL